MLSSTNSPLKTVSLSLALAALAALGPARPATAQTFTVTFIGTVAGIASSGSSPVPNPWGAGVQVGTPFIETFTWDRSAPATIATSLITRWSTQDIARGADITLGGLHISPFQNSNQVTQQPFSPGYFVQTSEANGNRAGSPPSISFVSAAGLMTGAAAGVQYQDAETALVDPTGRTVVSLTDPGADWLDPTLTGSEFNLFAQGQGTTVYNLWGTINGVTGRGLTPAPEPSQSAALALGALGLIWLAVKARRRQCPKGAETANL